MTPEDNELLREMTEAYERDGDMLVKNAAAAIERLSAELSEYRNVPTHPVVMRDREIAKLKEELAALRAQIAEAQPVATRLGTDWNAHHQCFAQLAHLDPGTELYTHPAADAKDAARYRACCENTQLFIDAAFAESKSKKGKEVIDAAIDAAMKSE